MPLPPTWSTIGADSRVRSRSVPDPHRAMAVGRSLDVLERWWHEPDVVPMRDAPAGCPERTDSARPRHGEGVLGACRVSSRAGECMRKASRTASRAGDCVPEGSRTPSRAGECVRKAFRALSRERERPQEGSGASSPGRGAAFVTNNESTRRRPPGNSSMRCGSTPLYASRAALVPSHRSRPGPSQAGVPVDHMGRARGAYPTTRPPKAATRSPTRRTPAPRRHRLVQGRGGLTERRLAHRLARGRTRSPRWLGGAAGRHAAP